MICFEHAGRRSVHDRVSSYEENICMPHKVLFGLLFCRRKHIVSLVVCRYPWLVGRPPQDWRSVCARLCLTLGDRHVGRQEVQARPLQVGEWPQSERLSWHVRSRRMRFRHSAPQFVHPELLPRKRAPFSRQQPSPSDSAASIWHALGQANPLKRPAPENHNAQDHKALRLVFPVARSARYRRRPRGQFSQAYPKTSWHGRSMRVVPR